NGRYKVSASLVVAAIFCSLESGAALASAQATRSAPDSTLHRVHDALFETWLPLDSLSGADSLRPSARLLRDELWNAFSRSAFIHSALAKLDSTAALRLACPGSISSLATASFADLALPDREALLLGLLRCQSNDARRLAMRLRFAYLSSIY